MVTGGLGYMGITLGESLFEAFDARLVLVGRSTFPDPEQWLERAEDPSFDDHEREILRRLAAMRSVRDDVLVLTADLRDEAQVRARRSMPRASGSARSTWSSTARRTSAPRPSAPSPRPGGR